MSLSHLRLGLILIFNWAQSSYAEQAACEDATQKCGAEEHATEDLSALLQRGVPNVAVASVLDSQHGRHMSQLDKSASMISNILMGETPKSEVEIVLAHYDEDVQWSSPYKNIRTIYCKGPQKKRPDGCVPLKNVGREGHTYLYHIVKNYENLSQWTVFTQAQAPTMGYRGHRLGGGHALPGVPFDAYVLPESAGGLPRDDGAAFVFTGAVHMPTLNHSLRLSFLQASYSPELHRQSKCPRTELLDGWEKWWDLGWFKKFIGGRCKCKAEDVPALFNQYWEKYIQLPRQENDIIFFSQGARFAASAERIRQRPKAFYEALLEKLSTRQDPCHNYFNEWIWYYILGKPEKAPCNVKLVVDEANINRWKQSEQELLMEEVEKTTGRV